MVPLNHSHPLYITINVDVDDMESQTFVPRLAIIRAHIPHSTFTQHPAKHLPTFSVTSTTFWCPASNVSLLTYSTKVGIVVISELNSHIYSRCPPFYVRSTHWHHHVEMSSTSCGHCGAGFGFQHHYTTLAGFVTHSALRRCLYGFPLL